MYHEKIGNVLRNLRAKSGYTQQQIADILRCSRSTYTYYETGKTQPDIESSLLLARVFNVPIGDLLSEEHPRPSLSDSRAPRKRVRTNTSHIFDLSSKEVAIVGAFRACSSQEQSELLQQVLKKRKDSPPRDGKRKCVLEEPETPDPKK